MLFSGKYQEEEIAFCDWAASGPRHNHVTAHPGFLCSLTSNTRPAQYVVQRLRELWPAISASNNDSFFLSRLLSDPVAAILHRSDHPTLILSCSAKHSPSSFLIIGHRNSYSLTNLFNIKRKWTQQQPLLLWRQVRQCLSQ